jgi:hypothetical protein
MSRMRDFNAFADGGIGPRHTDASIHLLSHRSLQSICINLFQAVRFLTDVSDDIDVNVTALHDPGSLVLALPAPSKTQKIGLGDSMESIDYGEFQPLELGAPSQTVRPESLNRRSG